MQAGSEFNQGFAIWIDWNQDLDYNDPGELVFSNAPTGNVVNGTIQVPATALTGVTRMRVRCCYITTPLNPCTLQGWASQYGEVEEYNVEVVSNTASVVTVSDQTICAGTSTQITATAQGIIRWYLNQTSTAQIALGATFTTPVLNTTTTYWVQATFGPCTTPRVPVVITVTPPFAVTVAASQNPVCSGTPFTLTASSAQTGLTYQWTPVAAFNNASQNPATLSITANTTFNVTATTAAGCTGTGSLAVTVLAAPVLNVVAASPSICPGLSTTLTASNAGPTYNWSPSTGLSATTGAVVTATPTATTTYTVTSPAATGTCAAAGTVTVTINPNATVNAGPDVAICAGTATTLGASGSSTYAWSPSAGLSASNIANPIANPSATTTYTVTGTSAQGCITSDQVIVTVNPIPVANPGSGAANCSGTGAQLNGSGGVGYQWSPATGLSSATIENPIASPATTTNYTLTVTNAAGCVSAPSAAIAVTVYQQPAAPVITASGPITFCQGGSVQLSAPAASVYLWSNGATTQSITVTQSGTFTVRITDANGCTSPNSAATNVVVNVLPAVPTITASGPLTFCDGFSVNLTSTSAAAYSWTGGGLSQTIIASSSGSYAVTVTNANGCQATSAPTIVTEHPPLIEIAVTANGPLSFCPGGSVTLSAPSAASYLWNTGATTQTVVASTTAYFSVVITDANGCVSPTSYPLSTELFTTPNAPTINSMGAYPVCVGQTAQLISSAASQYLWSTGATTQNISVTSAGAYTLQIRDANGCQSLPSAPFNVTFLPTPAAPVISAVGPSTFCNGETVDLQAVGNGAITWNNGATGNLITVALSGQYTATLTDGNGCVSNNSSSVQVNVLPSPGNATISVSGPTDICEGDSVMLTANIAPSYVWSNGSTAQSIWVKTSGTYSVTINGNSCPPAIDQASKAVQVRPIPVPEIFADKTRDCMPVQIAFGMNAPGIGPFSYLWRFGDGTTSTIPTPNHVYSRSGFYDVTLTLTDVIGCSGQVSEKKFIEVLNRAVPIINVFPRVTTFSSPNVTLVSQTLNADSLIWDLGILGVFTGDTVVVALPDTGYYPFEYTVTTEAGCEVSIKDRLQMIPDFMYYVPNGFTPNGDDLNDVFMPICSGVSPKGFEFMVFNRWGDEVYSTTKFGEGWDGKDAALGVYTWKIVGRSLLGEDKVITGHVTLLR